MGMTLNHQGEFGLIFGSPLPGVDAERGDFADECGRKFAFTFFTLFSELWQRSPFPVPAPQDIDARLCEQEDATPMFEITLAELAQNVGLRYTPGPDATAGRS
jgi:hypothetical protein